MRPTQKLKLQLFGAFYVDVKGRAAHLESRTVEALLAYLALHRDRSHARETLCSLFWPEKSEPNARMNLRHALYALRRTLGPDIVVADRRTVRLNPEVPLELDVEAFERLLARAQSALTPAERIYRLRQALALYRGPLMEGFYHDWVIEEGQRLREQFLDALLQLSEAHLEQGNLTEALACCERLLQEDPYREEAYHRGMLALARIGRPAEALQLYRRCREALQELQLDPSPATRQLAEWIAQGKLVGRAPPRIAARPPEDREQRQSPQERAWRLSALGGLARERGDLLRAERLYKEALAVALHHRDPESLVEARLGLGLVFWQRGDLRRAQEELERSLQAARRVHDARRTADALMNLGIVAMQRGRYPEAHRSYVEALWIYRRRGERGGMARALNNLAILAYHRGEHARAARLFERTLKFAYRQNDLKLAARCLNNLGNLARRLQRYDEAEGRLRTALEFFEELGDAREAANTRANLGAVALARGDLPEARRRLEQALRQAWEGEAHGVVHYTLVRFAQLLLAEDKPARTAEIAALLQRRSEPGSWVHRRVGKLLQELRRSHPEALAPARQRAREGTLEALVLDLLHPPHSPA